MILNFFILGILMQIINKFIMGLLGAKKKKKKKKKLL